MKTKLKVKNNFNPDQKVVGNLAGLGVREVQELRADFFVYLALAVEQEFVVVSVGCNHDDRVGVGAERANAVDRRTGWDRELAERPRTGEVFWQNLM